MSNFKSKIEDFYNDIMRMNRLAGNDYTDYSFSPRYNNLVREEIEGENETVDSILKKNYEGFVDGIVDVLVVGYFLYKVENKNKPVEPISKSFDKYLEVNEIASNVKELILYCQKNTITDNIENILFKAEQIAYTLNKYDVDIVGAFQEVMNSNFSKFPLVGDVDPEYELEYIKNQKRYTGLYYVVVDDVENGEKVKKYVFKNDKGKFVKPSCFKEPKIHMYLGNDDSLVHELYKYISK